MYIDGNQRMSKKLPHQHDINELLKALETASDDNLELLSYKNDVPAFLSKFKLEPGKYFVTPTTLYKLYKIFSQEPISMFIFSNSVGEFIPRTSSRFMLNISPQKLIKILNPVTKHNNMSSSSIKTHYETFIKNCNISKGQKWIEGFLLFEVYRFYCIDKKVQKRLGYANFICISNLYFEHRRIGVSRGMWFKLDPQAIRILTPEHMERIREKRKKS